MGPSGIRLLNGDHRGRGRAVLGEPLDWPPSPTRRRGPTRRWVETRHRSSAETMRCSDAAPLVGDVAVPVIEPRLSPAVAAEARLRARRRGRSLRRRRGTQTRAQHIPTVPSCCHAGSGLAIARRWRSTETQAGSQRRRLGLDGRSGPEPSQAVRPRPEAAAASPDPSSAPAW